MQYLTTILLSALLTGSSMAAPAANSKLNQYASIADCQADRNIISHASPPEATCHTVDSRTGAVYLVVGSGAAGAKYIARPNGDCKGDSLGTLATGSCITLPGGTKGIDFGLDW